MQQREYLQMEEKEEMKSKELIREQAKVLDFDIDVFHAFPSNSYV